MVTVKNPHARQIHVNLRVNDRTHNERFEDRYNEEFVLPASIITTLSIPVSRIQYAPLGRTMDMEHVRDLLVFQEASRGDPPPNVLEIRLSH
jgi:hypothetical protein